MLCGEPFLWKPWDVGRITDEWYERVIADYARKRNRAQGGPRSPADRPGAKRLPSKKEYVAVGVTLGGNREDLEAGYARWRAKQGKGAKRGN